MKKEYDFSKAERGKFLNSGVIMEQTSWEREIIKYAERIKFDSFWVRIHFLEDWKYFLAMFLVYGSVSYLLFWWLSFMKWPVDCLGYFMIFLIIATSEHYRRMFVIKKLSERIKKLEQENKK